MVFSAYLLENTILVLSQGEEFALYFWAQPWGICSFCKTKWQMPDKCPGGGGGGDGHAWNWLSHNEKKKLFPLKFGFAVFTDKAWRDLFSSCGDISSKTIVNSFSVWNHSVKYNNNKKLNSVLSFGNAWRWKIDETGKKVF